MSCRSSNLLILISDSKPVILDKNSPIGWYILYSPLNPSRPEPFYFIAQDSPYYGYSSEPITNENSPITSEIGVGKCEIFYAYVEEAVNSWGKNEDSDGSQENIFYLNGRLLDQEFFPNISRQFYSFYSTGYAFDEDQPGLVDNTTLLLTSSRPVGRSDTDQFFGTPINLVVRVVEGFDTQPVLNVSGSILYGINYPKIEDNGRFAQIILEMAAIGVENTFIYNSPNIINCEFSSSYGEEIKYYIEGRKVTFVVSDQVTDSRIEIFVSYRNDRVLSI
jgi:hypothetical protein